MRVGRGELLAGRSLLVALIAITILPFVSVLTTALHPSGSAPAGIAWPADPQWGNFVEAFKVANMTALLASSTWIVVAVVPVALLNFVPLYEALTERVIEIFELALIFAAKFAIAG